MKAFMIKIVVMVALLVTVDKVLGKALEHYYMEIPTGQNAQVNYSINKAKEEVFIYGSSRANHHYVPSLIHDSLNLSCYNAGIDGQTILYHGCVLKTVIARSVFPKVIILDLHPNEFQLPRGFNELNILLPYYASRPEIRPTLNNRSQMEKYKVFSDLYRYNSLVAKIVKGNISPVSTSTNDGYVPLTKKWKLPIVEDQAEKLSIDPYKVEALKIFLEDATHVGAKVFIFVSPLYKIHDQTPTLKIATDLCKQFNLSIYDYSSDKRFTTHPELFSDPSHLNDDGAKKYTNLIIQDIKTKM